MITGPRMILHMPGDPAFLQAAAEVSISHAALDHALKMCVKTLAGITVEVALPALRREGSRMLRDRIRKLARMRLGEGASLLKLQAILSQCEDVTEERNRLTHGVIAVLDNGQTRMQTDTGNWEELPTASMLERLAERIVHLVAHIHHERLNGFLAMALRDRKLPDGV
jgi:hypothetical protein